MATPLVDDVHRPVIGMLKAENRLSSNPAVDARLLLSVPTLGIVLAVPSSRRDP